MPSSYPFCASKINALETKNITTEKLNRMIEMPDVASAIKILNEVGYGGALAINNENEYEKLLRRELFIVVENMKELTPNEKATNLFLKKFDYHNLKVILKSKFFKKDLNENLFLPNGEFNAEEIAEKLFEDEYSYLNDYMKEAINKIYEHALNNVLSPDVVDLEMDKAMYDDIFNGLKKAKDNMVKLYFEKEVDLINIGIAFRGKLLKLGYNKINKMLIKHTSLDIDFLCKFEEKTFENILEEFKFTEYNDVVKNVVNDINEGKGLVSFERYMDNYLYGIFKENSFDFETIAPMLGYYLGKLNEIKNIRLVLVCLTNGLDKTLIRERLRS